MQTFKKLPMHIPIIMTKLYIIIDVIVISLSTEVVSGFNKKIKIDIVKSRFCLILGG